MDKNNLSVVFSITGLLVSLVTFYLNYSATEKNTTVTRKPVLVFEYQDNIGWTLRNVGAGPALNVIVAQSLSNGTWINPVRIPPLSKDGNFVLTWLGHVNSTGLGATYYDIEQLPYSSTCNNDLSKVIIGHSFGPWKEADIGKHWNQPPYKRNKIN